MILDYGDKIYLIINFLQIREVFHQKNLVESPFNSSWKLKISCSEMNEILCKIENISNYIQVNQ